MKPFDKPKRQETRETMPRERRSRGESHYDEWDTHDRHHRRRLRLASRFAIVLPIFITLAVCGGVAWFVFKPSGDAADSPPPTASQKNHEAFTDRATAFKVLELMEANRFSEAITWAETITAKFSHSEQEISTQVSKNPHETRNRLETFICRWIFIEYAAATQSASARARGWPSSSTPDAVVDFLCAYADYRARNFTPPPREINEELLVRIFLLAVHEKQRRAGMM